MKKGNFIQNWDVSYEELATTYNDDHIQSRDDLLQLLEYEYVYEDIIKNIKKPIHEIKTLEIGCGGARVSVYLAKKGMQVTCTDNAREALRLAEANFKKENAKNYTLVEDDLLHSKLIPESYDVVMSFGLLEHFLDLDELFTAMSRFIRPGGIHIHDIITKRFSIRKVTEIWNTIARFLKRFFTFQWKKMFTESYIPFPHYENSYSLDQYVEAMDRSGCNLVYRGGMVFWTFFALPRSWQRALVSWAKRHPDFFRNLDRSGKKWMEVVGATWWLVGKKREKIGS